jgi:hypothetical protein
MNGFRDGVFADRYVAVAMDPDVGVAASSHVVFR